jgi:hypothetical protein
MPSGCRSAPSRSDVPGRSAVSPSTLGRVSRRSWLVIALVVGVVVIAAVAVLRPRPQVAVVDPSATPSGVIASPSPSLVASPSIAPSPSVTPTPAPTVEPTPDPTATPKAEATGDPRLLYAEFLLRVNDDRTEVAELNAALTKAAEAQDLADVRTAAVDILDFVDAERDWLREHPPARCYRDAHEAANEMLAAYGTAAERFIDWTTAEAGLDRLAAFTDALDAASQAGDALTAFGQALEATSCP